MKEDRLEAGGSAGSRRGGKAKSNSVTAAAKGGGQGKDQRPSSGYRGSAEGAAQMKKAIKNSGNKKQKSSQDDSSDELVPLNAQAGLELQQDSEVIEPNSQHASVTREAQKIKDSIDKKLSKEEQEMLQKITKIEGVQSIYSVVETYPNKFKEMLDLLVADSGDSDATQSRSKKNSQLAEQLIDQSILKTVFMYFFELVGIQEAKDLELVLEKLLTYKKE